MSVSGPGREPGGREHRLYKLEKKHPAVMPKGRGGLTELQSCPQYPTCYCDLTGRCHYPSKSLCRSPHLCLPLPSLTPLCVHTQSCLSLWDPWTVAHQVLLSMGFPRQERWSGLPFSLPGEIFPTQGSNPGLQGPLHWQVDSLPLSHLENPIIPIVQTKSEAETNQSSGPEFGP